MLVHGRCRDGSLEVTYGAEAVRYCPPLTCVIVLMMSSYIFRLSAACALLFALGSVVGGWATDAQARARVSDVSFTERADGRGFVVRIHASERIDAYSMPRTMGDDRLEWTLFNAALEEGFRHRPPKGPITSYRASVQDGHLTFEFDLNGTQTIQANAYRDRASDDLLLNLTYADAPPAEPVASSSSPAGSSNASVATPASTHGASSRERWLLDTVVIDPGHGGKDPGTQGHGFDEKDIVLDVAKILGGYLEEKLGINVVYTRTDDRFIELHERGRIANAAEGKLFISLHANAIEGASARGTETFFLGQHKTEAARRVMERENRVVNMEANAERYEALDEEKLVRYALMQSANMRQSEYLASLIEEQFEERVNRKSRGVKQAGFQVLWEASMPAVLVELGFLTHSNEANFLASENGKVYLASAIFRAVREYKRQYEKGMNIARSND
jgi:N-acetylmuramoyl-L-alanine amidase